jgi:hypothetical protein
MLDGTRLAEHHSNQNAAHRKSLRNGDATLSCESFSYVENGLRKPQKSHTLLRFTCAKYWLPDLRLGNQGLNGAPRRNCRRQRPLTSLWQPLDSTRDFDDQFPRRAKPLRCKSDYCNGEEKQDAPTRPLTSTYTADLAQQ